MKLLHVNKHGIRIVRRDFVNRSEVKVYGLDNRPIMTYRFNNVPTYEHQMLSWANLDCCGGWRYDDDYLKTAVQNGLKPVADVFLKIDERMDVEGDNIDIHYEVNKWDERYQSALVALKQPLSDLFDIHEITKAYRRQDVCLDECRLESYMSIPLNELFRDRFWVCTVTNEELVITGLGLGYPIESTASLILGH